MVLILEDNACRRMIFSSVRISSRTGRREKKLTLVREQTTSILRVEVPWLILRIGRNVRRAIVIVAIVLGKHQREN